MQPRRSARNRAYASEPTSVPASSKCSSGRASPNIYASNCVDEDRRIYRSQASFDGSRELDKLKLECRGKKLTFTTQGGNICVNRGVLLLLQVPNIPEKVRLARISVAWSMTDAEIESNFRLIASMSSSRSPEIERTIENQGGKESPS